MPATRPPRALRGFAFPVPRFAFVPLLVLPSFLTQDPWLVLDRASAAYAAVTTLTADFVQVVDNPLVGEPDTTRGVLFLERPGRFAMRFTDPQGDRLVADGRFLWLYTPSTAPNQVIRTRIPDTGGVTPNLIGQFVDRPRERYQARWVRADSGGGSAADVVALTPRDASAGYREAAIWVDRGDGLVRRVEIVEASGQRRVVVLRGLTRNPTIPGRELRFTPPAGARVVDQ
jgi:outer membrane lipoprotein carrier protein